MRSAWFCITFYGPISLLTLLLAGCSAASGYLISSESTVEPTRSTASTSSAPAREIANLHSNNPCSLFRSSKEKQSVTMHCTVVLDDLVTDEAKYKVSEANLCLHYTHGTDSDFAVLRGFISVAEKLEGGERRVKWKNLQVALARAKQDRYVASSGKFNFSTSADYAEVTDFVPLSNDLQHFVFDGKKGQLYYELSHPEDLISIVDIPVCQLSTNIGCTVDKQW